MSRLSIRQLQLKRGGKVVLRDISLEVAAGDLLVVIGRSGSGKSSLLRCINRLNDLEAGRILLDGRDINELPITELRRKVGMLFQKSTTFEGSVADNIGFGARLHGKALPRKAILELMAQASLEAGLVDEPAAKLSGGQEQRPRDSQALALSPSLLLLDEPTSALDPIATKSVEAALMRLRNESNLTMIWVSHSIEQARRVGSRVLLLEAGRVLRVDSVDKMLDPQTGDKRALAFAGGDEAGMQAQPKSSQ